MECESFSLARQTGGERRFHEGGDSPRKIHFPTLAEQIKVPPVQRVLGACEKLEFQNIQLQFGVSETLEF